MGRQRLNSDLGAFCKDASERGLTYAEAQIQETCRMIGRVRAPRGDDPEDIPYQKASTRSLLKRMEQ